jgi:hypothetical protein
VPRGIPASGCFSPIVNFFCAKALSKFSVSMRSVERKLRRPPSRSSQGPWTHFVSSKPCLILLLANFWPANSIVGTERVVSAGHGCPEYSGRCTRLVGASPCNQCFWCQRGRSVGGRPEQRQSVGQKFI